MHPRACVLAGVAAALCLLALAAPASASAVCSNMSTIVPAREAQCPSTAEPPALVADQDKVAVVASLLTAADSVGGYTLAGHLAGAAARLNPDNAANFYLYLSHAFPASDGAIRAHGSTGAFLSQWEINRGTLEVLAGWDFVQSASDIHLNTKTSPTFQELGTALIQPAKSLWNSLTEKGTKDTLLFVGERTADGRAFATQLTGNFKGHMMEMSVFGQVSYGSIAVAPVEQDRTVAAAIDNGADDEFGYVFVYKGTKRAYTASMSSNPWGAVLAAGLDGGDLFCVSIPSVATESASPVISPQDFRLKAMKEKNKNLHADAAKDCTKFARPYGGQWNPNNPTQFWFTTAGEGREQSYTRVWSLRFTGTATKFDPSTSGVAGKARVEIQLGVDEFPFQALAIDATNDFVYLSQADNDLGDGKLVMKFRESDSHFACLAATHKTDSSHVTALLPLVDVVGSGFVLGAYLDSSTYGSTSAVGTDGQLVVVHDSAARRTEPALVTGVTKEPAQSAYNVSQTILFRAQAYSPNDVLGVLPSATIVGYLWDFGDGSAETHTAASTVEHAYAAEGTYTVRVTAQTQDSAHDGSGTTAVLVGTTTDDTDTNPPTRPPQHWDQSPSVPGPVPSFGRHAFYTGVFMLGFTLMLVSILALTFISVRYVSLGR